MDLKDIETPLQKCRKCWEEFKSADFKPGTSVCHMCYRKSKAKDTFWVPLDSTGPSSTKTGIHFPDLDDGNMLTGTRSPSLDDRTVSIDRETLNSLRNNKLPEKEVKNSPRATQNGKDTMSDVSKTPKNLEVDDNATAQQDMAENSAIDVPEVVYVPIVIREQGDDSAIDDRASFGTERPETFWLDDAVVRKVVDVPNVIQAHGNDSAMDDRVGLGVASTNREDCSAKREQPVCGRDREESTIFPQNSYRSEELDCLFVHKECDEPSIDRNETLIESQKSMKENISKEKSPVDVAQKKLVSESCRQTLECLSAHMTCLESNIITSDAINHLNSQSSAGKCPLVDQSTGEGGQSVDQSSSEKSISPEVDYVQKLISNDLQQQPVTLGEFVNSDITRHQVVIVNPFPSPIPPKTPMVNVSSNCQCNRYVSLARTPGTRGMKKGKRSGANGQKTGANGQNSEVNRLKTGNKSKKASLKDTEKGGEKGKQGRRVISAKKFGKKKIPQTPVKEISVIQTELIAKTDEEKGLLPQKTNENLQLETNIPPAPVRETTFVKVLLPVLSPIPEASRSGSSVQESSKEGFLSLPDVYPPKTEQGSDILLEGELEMISVGYAGNNTNEQSPVEPVTSRPSSVDVSQSQKSEMEEIKSENNKNLDDLLQEILYETDELEKNHERHRVARKTSIEEHADHEFITQTNTSANAQTAGTETVVHSKNGIDESKKNFVAAWIHQHHMTNPHDPSSVYHRGSSALVRATSSDANPRNSSYESSGSTPLPPTTDFSSHSNDDTMESTSGDCDNMVKSTVQARSATISQKPADSYAADDTSDRVDYTSGTEQDRRISDATSTTFSGGSSTTIPLPSGSTASGSTAFGVSFHSFGGELTSRITTVRKSETPCTGSEMISSEEEEIVWRKGDMLGKGAFGKVS